jgi:predicted enzyme related to lactoylglutathione lyase
MTATLTYTLGRFVWRELFTRDVEGAKRFYGALFGWTWEDRPMGPDWSYTLWKNGDKQIGGMMDLADMPGDSEKIPPHWAVYVSVENVDETAQRAVEAGGKILSDCHDIPGVGRFAVLQDPDGAVFNLFRSANGDPEDGMPGVGEFCWESLSMTNPAKALAFYQSIIGWGTTTMGEGENAMTLFTRVANGEPVTLASTGPAPEGTPSNWMTFVGVADAAETVATCCTLGGTVLVDRTPIPDVGAFAILQDPCGTVFAVFEADAC